AEIRGFKEIDVPRRTIGVDELKRINAQRFDTEQPPQYVAGSERLYKALGLLKEDQSLRQLYLDLIDSQVLGFYDPDTTTMYVVSRSGALSGADKITFAHEYDHALQDANFPGMFAEQKQLLDESDQGIARAAVFEGDGTLLMTQWAIPNMTPAELQDYAALAADPESAAVLARTPAILTESLTFPYTSGINFLAPMQAQGGWAAVDKVYADMPTSTEQILHPDKYASRETPVKVTLKTDGLLSALGAGWTETLQDTFGEFQMRTWLRQAGVSGTDAEAAAAGWGGDRLAVLTGPNGAWAMVMKTAWDTAADAEAFETAAQTAAAKAGGPAGVFPGEGGKTRWFVVGSDDATLQSVVGGLGLAG
ncbi:MAG TPA: hypothetical protein VFW02_11220, partial [Candidatus Limnocylindrales bacterium]|nr:hypothetical protein [Candidatus Limnocylindrales bacterium]